MSDKDLRNFIYGIHTSNAQLKLNPTDIEKIFIKKNSQNKQLKKIISISNQHNIPLEEVEKDLFNHTKFFK
jgi:tRNA G18 (ribose-2'-O)-methylase SpoU